MASPPPGPGAETALLAARLEAQLLAGAPATEPQAVVERLLAVQGQDARGARLAVRARSRGLAASDVDRGLTEGSLLITWLNRGTLHLVASQDYPWLHALTAPTVVAANARRLAQEGVTAQAAERGVRTIERALAREGPLDRQSLRERLQAAGVPTAGQALVHVLMLASLRGRVVRGPMVGARARLRAGGRLAAGAAGRSTAGRPWPSWRAATSGATAPPASATWPSGPACR